MRKYLIREFKEEIDSRYVRLHLLAPFSFTFIPSSSLPYFLNTQRLLGATIHSEAYLLSLLQSIDAQFDRETWDNSFGPFDQDLDECSKIYRDWFRGIFCSLSHSFLSLSLILLPLYSFSLPHFHLFSLFRCFSLFVLSLFSSPPFLISDRSNFVKSLVGEYDKGEAEGWKELDRFSCPDKPDLIPSYNLWRAPPGDVTAPIIEMYSPLSSRYFNEINLSDSSFSSHSFFEV